MVLKKLWKNLFGSGGGSAHAAVREARARAEGAFEALSSLARELGEAPASLAAGEKALAEAGRDEERGEADPDALAAAYDAAGKALLQGRTELLHAHPERMVREYVAWMEESAADIEAPTARTFARLQLAALHHLLGDAEAEGEELGRALAAIDGGEHLAAVTNSLQAIRTLGDGIDESWLIARCDDVRRRVGEWGDPVEEVAAMNELIRGRAALGDPDGALAWTRDVEDPWYREQACASVLETLAGRGEIARARELLAVLEDPPLVGAARKSIVCALARSDDFEGARREALAIEDEEGRDAALREVVELRARAGDVPGALALLEEIESERWRADARRGIAEARALEGDVAGALEAADGLEEGPPRLAGLVEVGRALAERGDFPAVRGIVERLHHAGSRALLLATLAAQLARRGRGEEASETLDLALETASGAGGDVPHDALVGAIAEVRAHAGAVEQAIEAAGGISQPNARAFVYHRIARDLVASGALAPLAGFETLCREPLGRTWFLLGAVSALRTGAGGAN